LLLPKTFFNKIINDVVNFMNYLAGMLADRIGAYTDDFASHSPFLLRFKEKVNVILPPVTMPPASPERIREYVKTNNPRGNSPVIGMATRFATEKGVEILINALPQVLKSFPSAMVMYAGQYQDVMGESAYYQKLLPSIQAYQEKGQWEFLGVLNPADMTLFYNCLDVLVVPSLNSTETFGLVQIEAMLQGTPTIASNLPGVRVPPRLTGMGEVVPIGDAGALAEAIIKIVSQPKKYQGSPQEIAARFDPLVNASAYEMIYKELLGDIP